jgi:hypothetical protein
MVPRPRKSRLVPSVGLFAEELVRAISEHVDKRLDALRESLEGELNALRRDVQRLRASGVAPTAHTGRPRSTKLCSVKSCGLPHIARGLCKNHYQQLRYAERKQR